MLWCSKSTTQTYLPLNSAICGGKTHIWHIYTINSLESRDSRIWLMIKWFARTQIDLMHSIMCHTHAVFQNLLRKSKCVNTHRLLFNMTLSQVSLFRSLNTTMTTRNQTRCHRTTLDHSNPFKPRWSLSPSIIQTSIKQTHKAETAQKTHYSTLPSSSPRPQLTNQNNVSHDWTPSHTNPSPFPSPDVSRASSKYTNNALDGTPTVHTPCRPPLSSTHRAWSTQCHFGPWNTSRAARRGNPRWVRGRNRRGAARWRRWDRGDSLWRLRSSRRDRRIGHFLVGVMGRGRARGLFRVVLLLWVVVRGWFVVVLGCGKMMYRGGQWELLKAGGEVWWARGKWIGVLIDCGKNVFFHSSHWEGELVCWMLKRRVIWGRHRYMELSQCRLHPPLPKHRRRTSWWWRCTLREVSDMKA